MNQRPAHVVDLLGLFRPVQNNDLSNVFYVAVTVLSLFCLRVFLHEQTPSSILAIMLDLINDGDSEYTQPNIPMRSHH